MKRYDRALVWFRRDLRAEDHAALSRALKESRSVHCLFVFDADILDQLPDKADRRVEFIWHSLLDLRSRLQAMGGDLHVAHGRARDVIPAFAARHGIEAVYANHDYEPAAIARDREVAERLAEQQRTLHTFKDQVIFEKSEILKHDGRPYVVFTPYKKAWLARITDRDTDPWPVASHAGALNPEPAQPIPSLEQIGFTSTNLLQIDIPVASGGAQNLLCDFLGRVAAYGESRDYPALAGTSQLSVHLRFGTISIRELVRTAFALDADPGAREGAAKWLSELIWREFYFSILANFPHVVGHTFRREYDALAYNNSEMDFQAWCDGATGYPIVDAAMRQLNSTGYMHNRLRMVSASFLVKDLSVDWRWGERYFADKLNDFDLAANNGGWQWCASTGCDAQPYFRIFNPVTQSQKFDPTGTFIRSQLPQLARVPDKFVHEPWKMPLEVQRNRSCVIGVDYPAPIVDHATARKRALAMYSAARGRKK